MHITDSYEINIDFLDNYPMSLPEVYEIGGRKELLIKEKGLTAITDIHYYTDGSACLCYRSAFRKYFPPDSGIDVYLCKLVEPFYYGQSYYEKKDKWPFGDLGHGPMGLIDYYFEELDIEDINIIGECLILLSKDNKVKGNRPCLCGSKAAFKKCHPQLFERVCKLRNEILPVEAKADLKDIIDLYKTVAEHRNKRDHYNKVIEKLAHDYYRTKSF